ncbi:consortin isoform X2 [Hemicordylus capensis]|uniref:consortin isoform X2 n=1 Tax=Hemicordylus capensis TaxID=884348 RepID=UPI002302880A|nr:consortin isoform X2 [Hemicordylus capensis]
MDDGESPTNDLQLNLQDLLHADTHVERIKTCLASSADENENQLNGSKHETLKSSDATMGRVEQDSINNNEGKDSGDYTSCYQEEESDTLSRCSSADEMLIPEKCSSGKRSSRKTKGSSKQGAKQEKTDVTATDHVQDEHGNKIYANCPQKEATDTLQSLFSLLREEFEQMDSRVLPLCLHQIAETYFQGGEYEKAMKFIQLERLYHEQLLANLSSVQQQWEKKWKSTPSSEIPILKNSAKGLDNEELDKLAELCTSHQEPLVSRSKRICEEKSQGRDNLLGLKISEESKEKGAVAHAETWPGIRPKKEDHHKERERSKGFKADSCHTLTERARLQLAVGKDHMEEEHCSAESTLNPPSQPIGTQGTPCSGCLSSRSASEDNSLPLREEQFSEDVAKIEAAAEEPAAECSSEPMVDTLVLTDADYMPPDLISTDENVQSERNFLRSKHCPGSTVISSSQLGSSIVNQQQPPYGNEKKSVQDRTSSDIIENVCSESNMPEQANVAYANISEGIQEGRAELEEEGKSEGPEDFFDRFFSGMQEDPLKYVDSEGDGETIPHMTPEQALYSSSEGYSLEEGFSSLDELAKRIEIAETVPTEGLVSILKKRDDSEGKTLAQLQQRQSKRRVRFQEMEDALDQEEVGGGSCILLILLCIATVFLSVGGTALYCTFGDAESPVCTEFAANMDFYCTRMLQSIEELKQWISFS